MHPILAERLSAALAPVASPQLTPRDARLPALPGKAHAVIGMRRAGKTRGGKLPEVNKPSVMMRHETT